MQQKQLEEIEEFLIKIKVEKKDNYFGIICDGKEIVPFEHDSKESAIQEWVLFEKINATEGQFLDHIRSIEEIDIIASELNNHNHFEMQQETKKYIDLGIKVVSIYDVLLNLLNELESFGVHKQKVKQTGNMFRKELEKEIAKFYSIAKDEESQKVMYSEIKKIETVLENIFEK